MAKSDAKIHKVMSEFKDRELHSGSKEGPVVTSRKQAVAIALSEAGKAKKGRGRRGSVPGVKRASNK